MRALLPLLLLSIGAVSSACTGEDATDAGEAAMDLAAAKLSVATKAALPLKEISGLGVRTIEGRPQYLAIGDSSTTLVTFDVGRDGVPANVEQRDLGPAFGGADSQWEAVAGDAAGNVLIMSEGDATIAVLNAELRLQHVITLTLPRENPLYTSWDRDDNSRGEGMLLLSNGHILVAKEKGPSAIIEFAPKGEAAAGYTPALALKGPFPHPRGDASELVAVKSWELKASSARLLGDMSDLTIGADGSILVLSDQSRAIGRIERELGVDEDKIDLKAIWELPREVEKPEGLQLVNGAPIVACDLSSASATSFFSISAL